MSVIMSVMKTSAKTTRKKKPAAAKELPREFTVRDMNRHTALVLAACRQHGRVVVKHRGGEQFAVTPVVEVSEQDRQERIRQALERMRLHRERIRAMGMRGPATEEEIERVNQIIAGEI